MHSLRSPGAAPSAARGGRAQPSAWARRSLAYPAPPGQARFGIVQGATHVDLRLAHLDDLWNAGVRIFSDDGDTVAGAETAEEVVIEDRPWEQTFSINGDDAFNARVQADLDMLNSSPTSQALLAEIRAHVDNGGDLIDINATDGGNTGGTSVAYNTSNLLIHGDDAWYKDGRPPVIGLYHELGHVNQWRQPGGPDRWYDGSEPIRDADGQPLLERQNVGLNWDYDDDPNTPDGIDPDWDFRFTENGLREEFGLPRRDRY